MPVALPSDILLYLYGPATCKYPEKTINGVNGASGYSRPANPEVSRQATGWICDVHPIPLHRSMPVSVRQMQMVNAFIRRRDRGDHGKNRK